MRKASSVMKKTLIASGQSGGKAQQQHAEDETRSAPSDPTDQEPKRRGRSGSTRKTRALSNAAAATTTAPPLPASSSALSDRIEVPAPTLASAASSESLGVDMPILPSSSTFTLPGKEDKAEKLRKKAKNFLDERQKTKSRAQSLWSYIGATNTFDQARFFQENAEQVFYVVYETCMHHVEKIKQKHERPQSWSSKELVNLQKNLLLLRKIFLYVPELMRNGWQRKNIAKLLSYILDHGNHLRLRSLGFHLLLLWLNDQVVEYPECMELFANAISLDLFILDDVRPIATPVSAGDTASHDEREPPKQHQHHHHGGLQFVKKLSERQSERATGHGLHRDDRVKKSQLKLHQTLIQGDDQAPLYPNPAQPTYNDSIVLLHIFISNLVRLAYVAAGSPPPPDDYEYPPGDSIEADDGIATGIGIDAATASAKFLFRIFRTYYLTKFTPEIAARLKMDGLPPLEPGESFGFPVCPPSILRTLLKFLIAFALDNNNDSVGGGGSSAALSAVSASSPATPIMKSIVLSSYETREMLHEILRQSLVLPGTNPDYRDITRGAIHVLGVWMLGNEDERPSFLRKTMSSSALAMMRSNSAESNAAATPTTTPTTTDADYKHADANRFLRRYFMMIKLVFEDHHARLNQKQSREAHLADLQQVTDWEGLVALYKDAINVYRAITVTRGGIDMEWESWELLLHCLLDIQDWFLNQPEKYARIQVQSLAEDLADYICETLLHAFVRAKIAHAERWKELKEHMIASLRWPQALGQWVKIMHKMTRVLSLRLYKVEYGPMVDSDEPLPSRVNIAHATGRGRSNTNKVRSRHLSIQGDHPRLRKWADGRPLSAGGSDGQLVDLPQDKAQASPPVDKSIEETVSSSAPATQTMIRNVSNISLSDKASHRRSAHFVDIDESTDEGGGAGTGADEAPEEEDMSGSSSTGRAGNMKFIKNIMPTASFSASNAPNSAGSIHAKRGSSSRRTASIHQLDTIWQDSGSKLLNFVHSSNDEVKDKEWDRKSGASSVERPIAEENTTLSSKSNRTSLSTLLPQGEVIALMTHRASVNDKLPAGLGMFRSSEFLQLHTIPWDPMHALETWKNMLCALGNVNAIESPQNYAIAMGCVVDIWDVLRWIRSHQPFHGGPKPALYEVTPWLLQATELSTAYDAGRAAAYGCLCRLMARRPEQPVPHNSYAHFYRALLMGLSSGNSTIIHAIIQNSERIFSLCLPGASILIPSFLHAIEEQLLDPEHARHTPTHVRKSCVTILGSLVTVSNHLPDVHVDMDPDQAAWIKGLDEPRFAFADIKVWLKDLLLRLVDGGTSYAVEQENTDIYCMLLGAICVLSLDELLTCEKPQQDIVCEGILALVNHLYCSNIAIINGVVDCLNIVGQVYREELDPDGIIVQEVLTRLIDALNMHLKYYSRNSKDGRGFIISKLFSCLMEWLMVIEPVILSDTELCQLVFDVIEYAIHVSTDGTPEKMLPHPPPQSAAMRSKSTKKKELPFKFKLLHEKRPDLQHEYVSVVSGQVTESDHGYVKESAEALLLHLLHHFNNFPPASGPATIHSTVVGPGVAASEDPLEEQYQYFAFNDTTIVAFVELAPTETEGSQARILLRDLTGRYCWDAQLQPKSLDSGSPDPASDHGLQEGLQLRPSVPIRSEKAAERPTTYESDKLGHLLARIGEENPDCRVDASVSLNEAAPLSALQDDLVGRLGDQLDEYLQSEADNNEQQETDVGLWYSKVRVLRQKQVAPTPERTESLHAHLTSNFSLRKDFLPSFPQEAEKPHVPFQQSRLLLSHLGLIHYDHLKDASFQMLNKTPALFRDLRGLDRKLGRETMKIAVIYVGPGQEDEQTILHNSHGSARYDAFVNSLGWEIDIATHTGYLGGLERNLTNGTRANYYCSSTLEMIFHDVTKMPTEAGDQKQLKKKRHIGNDHVHIVWNEHDRDYRVGTIGGDFGNAQIVVTPLPNGLFAVQVHRDPKVPYFGPLFSRMVVSQATLGPLVRATAITAFRASIHNNFYSFYKYVFAQRANDVKTIAQRHKIGNWSYEQFMERIFMPTDE